jgi:hypothetical protein
MRSRRTSAAADELSPTARCKRTRHHVRVYFRVALVVLVSLGAGFACRDAGSGSAGVTTTSAGPAGAVYLARPDDQWTLKEAYNPLPENTLTRTVEPSLDWYAEYEAPPANSPRRVRLSGHSSGVDESRPS